MSGENNFSTPRALPRTHPPPAPVRAGWAGNILRRSTSLFENSPFLSGIASATAGVEVDRQDQKAMKIAFYNTAALVFVAVLFYTLTQVFYILEFCIRPLLWALLLGAALHPIKQIGTELILAGIDTLSDTGAPWVLGIFALPVLAVQRLLSWLLSLAISTYREMILSLLLILLVLTTDMVDIIDTAADISSLLSELCGAALEVLEQYSVVVWTLVAGYLALVCWRGHSRPARILATPVWVLVVATVISHLGEWRAIIALFVFTVLGSGAYTALTGYTGASPGGGMARSSSLRERFEALDKGQDEEEEEGPAVRVKKRVEMCGTPLTSTPANRARAFSTPATTAAKSRYQTPATSRKQRPVKQASQKFLEAGNVVSTEKYFTVLGWSVFFTVVSRDVTLSLQLASLLIVFLLLSKLAGKLLSKDMMVRVVERVEGLSVSRFQVLFPRSIRGLTILMLRGQDIVLDVLRSSTNQVVSASIVLLMLLCLVLISCFILFTVHREVLYLLQASTFYINSHTSHHLQSLNASSFIDWSAGLSSAHSAGRGWIKTKISTLPETDNTRELESTLLTLYDSMYQHVLGRNVGSSRTNVTMSQLLTTVRGNVDSLQIVSLAALKSNLAHLVGGRCVSGEELTPQITLANYVLCSKGMILEVLDSLWTVVSSNLALLSRLLFTFASGIVEGGAAFLNFVVQSVVFVTALYYLLVYSDKYYAPVEVMVSLLRGSADKAEYTSALFQATRGIFGASLKLALFYGSYVWMTHALFGLEIVFVPALLAAVFSLVPVVGVYWSSVPGFLVLWLVDGRALRAGAFLALQILPTYVIDMAVYSEIEGGWHPYITGLAVAGGMYYFGLEGAIIGPLVICILKFTINLYDVLFNNMSNTTRQQPDTGAAGEALSD